MIYKVVEKFTRKQKWNMKQSGVNDSRRDLCLQEDLHFQNRANASLQSSRDGVGKTDVAAIAPELASCFGAKPNQKQQDWKLGQTTPGYTKQDGTGWRKDMKGQRENLESISWRALLEEFTES